MIENSSKMSRSGGNEEAKQLGNHKTVALLSAALASCSANIYCDCCLKGDTLTSRLFIVSVNYA